MKTKNHRQGCFGCGPPETGFHKSKFKLVFSMMTCLILMTGVAGAARLRVVIEHRVDDDAARTFTAMNHVGHGESVGIK